MLSLRIFLIVAASLAASIAVADGSTLVAADSRAERYRHAQTVFACTFDGSTNRDGWPDRWTRERSVRYPRYLEVKIDAASPVATGQSLRMNLDGGAAAAFSPTVPVNSLCSYVFEAQVKTEGLVHDRAFVSVTFYDRQHNVLERAVSAAVDGSSPWTRVKIGPVAPRSEEAKYATIGLHLEPAGAQADLHGSAWFANVWAGQLPRVKLQADSRTHLYVSPQQPEVTCTASGFVPDDLMIDFELLDVDDKVLQQFRRPIKESAVGGAANLVASQQAGARELREGRVTWRPPLPDVGFYRVRAAIDGDEADENVDRPEVALALVRSEAKVPGGEFGWAFSKGEQSLPLDELASLARQSGVAWLKFPLWGSEIENGAAKRELRVDAFVEALKSERISLVALLNEPPAGVRKKLDKGDAPLAAQVFPAEAEVWYPSLEGSVTRFGSDVHWWQLGSDSDLSFVNYPELNATLAAVRKQFEQYGRKMQLGVAWPADAFVETPAVDFISLSCTPENQAALGGYLKQTAGGKLKRFVNVQPSNEVNQTAAERATQLVQQMLWAKRLQADGVFVEAFHDSSNGLLCRDGTVGEALLPWRTAALMLGGADAIGSLRLPQGSVNHVFLRDGKLVMVLWNSQPAEEIVALGSELQQTDLWGRTMPLTPSGDGKYRVAVGPTPIFLTGLNEPLVRFQMAASVNPAQWPGTLGVPLQNTLKLQNTFPGVVSGSVRIIAPDRWRIVPRKIDFKLGKGQTLELPFEAMLPFDAGTGPQELQLEFDMASDRRFQFTVYRSVEVGNNDVTLEVTTRLNDAGELVVEQKLVNRTDKAVSFRCSLFIPGRKKLSTELLDQPRGVEVQRYTLPNGQELVGKKLWIRADEINGQRILNNHFEVAR